MPPCNHYKSPGELLRQDIHEVNEKLEETAGLEPDPDKDFVLPKLGRNQQNT